MLTALPAGGGAKIASDGASGKLARGPAPGPLREPGGFFIDPRGRWRGRWSAMGTAITRAPAIGRCWPRGDAGDHAARGWARGAGERSSRSAGARRRIGEVAVASAGRPCAGLGPGRAGVRGRRGSSTATTSARPDPTCAGFDARACDVFITEATSACRFPPPAAAAEIARLLHSRRAVPERCHVVGAYALGKAQRLIALLREAGWDGRSTCTGRCRLCDLYEAQRRRPGRLRPATAARRGRADGRDRDRPRPRPSPTAGRGGCRSGGRLASGWMRVRQRAKARRRRAAAGDLRPRRLGRAAATRSTRSAPPEVWVTHGREEALVHAAETRGIKGRAAAGRLRGGGDEAEDVVEAAPAGC